MDDPTGTDVGYSPSQYAYMLLRVEPVGNSMVSDTSDAASILIAATHDLCPHHVQDLPRAWAGGAAGHSPEPTKAIDALTLANAIGHIEAGYRKADLSTTVPQAWVDLIDMVDKYIKAGERPQAIDLIQSWADHLDSERTAATLADSMAKGIIVAPAQVQTAMDAATH